MLLHGTAVSREERGPLGRARGREQPNPDVCACCRVLTLVRPPACAVRGNRPGKQVQLQEYEIKFLCTKAREIFINQPILLELEAPIKICGAFASTVSCLLSRPPLGAGRC